MAIIKIFLTLFFIIILFIVLALGYIGVIPGLSSVFGSDKPRNLGIKYTQQDLESAQSKLQQTAIPVAANSEDKFDTLSGVPVETTLSSEEYSAHVELLHPISDVQIKLDGSNFEMSGRIDKSRIPNYVRAWGLTDVSDAEILNAVNKYLPVNPVFYLAGSGKVTNDDMQLNLTKAEFGRLPVPTDQAELVVELISETLFKEIDSFTAESTTIENSLLHFKGMSIPQIPKY